MGPIVSNSPSSFADLIDVTLADEDTNAIITDSANRAIQGNNVAMQVTQVTPSGGQICNYFQVTPSDGQRCN